MTKIKLPVVEGMAGSYSVFLGSAGLNVLSKISCVDRFMMDTNDGFQRPLDKGHAHKFRKYIEGAQNGQRATAPPLIFSLRVPKKLENGHLVIPREESAMARLDAQHRMEFTGDLPVDLPFVIYHGLSKQEEVEIFTTINDSQKGLAKSLVDAQHHSLRGDTAKQTDPHLAIAVQLNKDPNSPWFEAVNTGGISKSTPGSKRKITLRTFQLAIKELISGPRCENAPYDTKYQVTKNYWKAVSSTFSNAWVNHRKHLITKGVGIAALAELGQYIIEECLADEDSSIEAMAKYIKKLEGFDWGNKTSPLSLIGGQKGATAAAKAFKAVVFGDVAVDSISKLLMPFMPEESAIA
ncbi:MAG: DGQHR domain-containing protein [Acidobacteriaceae bacterium]|nr:DGQHR domain-containing protein [Acidobacteriaceae bacterium]